MAVHMMATTWISGGRARPARVAEALRLAELGICVAPGTYLNGCGCSCGWAACRAPGGHPADPGWLIHATTEPLTVMRWWERWPAANIVVPLLGRLHVVDTPGEVGLAVLSRLCPEDSAIPVAVTPQGRYHFWSVPGVGDEIAVLLERWGRSPVGADLRVYREGAYVLAPPSDLATGAYRWVRPPSAHVRHLTGSAALPRLVTEAYCAAETCATGDRTR